MRSIKNRLSITANNNGGVKTPTKKGYNMIINYKEVKKLKSFYDVKLKGNETFSELLQIERDFNERIKQDTKNIQSIDNQTRGN